MLIASSLRSSLIQLGERRIAIALMKITNGRSHCFVEEPSLLIYVPSDYNYVRDGNQCVLAGPQQIPAGECKNVADTYLGSSGYRKIPGNTCIAQGTPKDAKKVNDCSQGKRCVRNRILVSAKIVYRCCCSRSSLASKSRSSVQTMLQSADDCVDYSSSSHL